MIAKEKWPEHDPELVVDEEVTIVIQVNGKVKDRITMPVNSSEVDVKARVMENTKVLAALEGKDVQKVIVVPNRLVNIVLK